MGTRLYVGNLSYNVTEPELRDVFAEGGRNVVEVKIVMDRDTGRPRGFAFVEMGSDDEANAAISSLTGREIQGRAINVSEARARAPRAGGGGGFGGGGGGGGYGGGGGGGGYGGGGGGYGGGGRGRGDRGGGGGDYGEGRGRSRRGGW
ncbi:MAG TPA: RNA-binding protein [Polyangia bacterium]|nr:RNA-binding protein [Polyangia bacterium]